jgi:hypothetical protein
MSAQFNCTLTWSAGGSIRTVPNTNNTSVAGVAEGFSFQASEIVPDSSDPTNTNKAWLHIFGGLYDGKYIAQKYPASGSVDGVRCSYTLININPTPDPTPVTLVHTIQVYSDGSLVIDGKPYTSS